MPRAHPALHFAAALCAALSACAKTAGTVQLVPEERATLHVGDVAVVEVPSALHYSFGGAGGLQLVRTRQRAEMTLLVYRAVAAVNAVLVASPRDPGPDNCISCVTVHYFATVVQ